MKIFCLSPVASQVTCTNEEARQVEDTQALVEEQRKAG